MKRRRFLATGSLAGATALAGCTGLLDRDPTGAETSTATGPSRRWSVDLKDRIRPDQVAWDADYLYVVESGTVRAFDKTRGTAVAGHSFTDYGEGSVEVAAETVVTETAQTVAGFDAGLGAGPRWKQFGLEASDLGANGSIVIDRNDAYAGVGVADGGVRWMHKEPTSGSSLLAATDDLALVDGVVNGVVTLWAYARATGDERWSTELVSASRDYVPTAVVGESLLWGANSAHSDNRLLALATTDGTRRWETSLPGRGAAPIGVIDDAVIASTGGDGPELLALDTTTGERRWTRATTAPLAITDEWLVAGGDGPEFVAVGADGSRRWTYTAAEGTTSSGEADPQTRATITDEAVVLLYEHHLYGLDPVDGTERWHYAHDEPLTMLIPLDEGMIVSDGGSLLKIHTA